jgi:peptide deformylase
MELVIYPNDVLRESCDPVVVFDEELRKATEEMTTIMYSERGVGIASPQVGIKKNIIVVDPSGGSNLGLRVMVNPKLRWVSKETVRLSEVCLSIPGVIVSVERPISVEVEFQDVTGAAHVERHVSWFSRIIQHEMDHLQGKIMLDKMSAPVKSLYLKSYANRIARERKTV